MTPPSEWRLGWRVLLAAAIANMFAMLPFYTIGAVIKPISEAFGWSRASIASAASITSFGVALFTPLAGRFTDSYGPRRVGLIGLALCSFALAAVSLSGPSITTWYLAWCVVAVILPFGGSIVWVTGVTRQFDRHRGAALGLMLSGVSMAMAFGPVASSWLIEHLDWRAVFIAVGGMMLFVALPLTMLLFHPMRGEGAGDAGSHGGTIGVSFRAATRTVTYWQLIVACILAGAVGSVIVIHLQAAFSDQGMSPMRAAALASLIGPAAFIGRIGTGVLADRLHAPLVAAAILAFPAVTFVLLLSNSPSLLVQGTAMILGGLAVGGEIDLFAYLSSRCFGQRSFATIHGTVISAYGLGFAAMAWAAGWLFDVGGSYHLVMILGMAGAIAGALAVGSVGRDRMHFGHGGPTPPATH